MLPSLPHPPTRDPPLLIPSLSKESPLLSTPFNMLWRPPSLTSTPSAYTNPLSPSALSLPPLLLLMLLPPLLSTMLLPMLIPPMLLPLLLLPLLSSRPKLKIFGNPRAILKVTKIIRGNELFRVIRCHFPTRHLETQL